MISDILRSVMAGQLNLPIMIVSSLGVLAMLFGLAIPVSTRPKLVPSVSNRDVLPGVPQIKGYPIIGVLPLFLRKGASHLLSKLIQTGNQGISYASVAGNILVSVHDPTMVKEVLAFPDNVASRDGDARAGRVSWSPFWTLRRLYGTLALFTAVGPDIAHQRNVLQGEFNNNKTIIDKFDAIKRIASEHCADLLADHATTEGRVNDMRHIADNFAISLWGDLLYSNPHNHIDGKVLTLSNTIMDMAGSPWSAIWYYIQFLLRVISPGQPTRFEAKLRGQIAQVIGSNISKLHNHEAQARDESNHSNTTTMPKTIRSISLQTGGTPTGPLSKFATEFASLNLFGGHHSIGLMVVWTLIALDKHPEKLSKLLTEIDGITSMDFHTINSKVPYLDAVLSEISRLYPTVHATVRVINQEVRLESAASYHSRSEKDTNLEVTFKPGMLVYISFLHLHTAEKYWGSDAKEFVPERFLLERNGRKLGPLMSFGYGPRSCVGYKFTLVSMKVFLVALLKTYKFQLLEHDYEVKLDTLLEPSKAVSVGITRR